VWICVAMYRNSYYLEEVKGKDLHEWLETILPILDKGRVIIMENVPCHKVGIFRHLSME
jgi:hypothetical protein